VVGGSSPVPTGFGLGIEVDEAELRRMAARTPQPLPPHIPVLRVPSHGVDIHGDVPREVLGLEEGLLRGQSYEYWLEDGTAEWAEMAERVKRLGNYVAKVSRL
jgi:hypothetical protein